MENWRRQKWDNQRRSYNQKPPRGNWHPTVPSWEKQFCKVVGSMDWGTLLRIQKFTYIYDNVVNWDDSAVEQTFHNEKKRFFAKIKGLPCDIPLPDPDLYIDKIDWDNSEIDHGLLSDLENNLVISSTEENNGPVIIFGDAILPKQAVDGWGEEEENFEVPKNSSFNNGPATGWGDGGEDFEIPKNSSFNNGPVAGLNNGPANGYWGYNYSSAGWGSWSNNNNYVATGWGDYYNAGWEGWNYDSNNYEVGPGYEKAYWPPQNYDNNNYEVGPGYEEAYWGSWNEDNGGRYYKGSRGRGNDRYRSRNYQGGHNGAYVVDVAGVGKRRFHRGWDILTPYPPVSHQHGET